MKVKIPEPVSPEVLYERSLKFDDLHTLELADLLNGLKTALDIVCENKLKSREFSVLEYQIMFYRGEYEEGNFIGKDFMAGGMNLESRRKEMLVSGFRREYKELFRKVQEDFSKRPGSLNLDAVLIGYRDVITHEVEAFDPLEN